MERLEQQKDKRGSIVFFVAFLKAVFAVFLLIGMAYMFTRITQQENEIINLKTMIYQFHSHIKIKSRTAAEHRNQRRLGFQKTVFAGQDENDAEKPEISRKHRVVRSSGCDVKGSIAGGTIMFNESAHIVGDGKVNPIISISSIFLLTSWKKKHASGHMSYSSGFLTVGVEGYYYIYGQIYYVDGRSAIVGYIIYIDETPVVKAVNSVINNMRKFDTNYVGGVFHISPGQRISVRTPFKQKFKYGATTSYFGAFMVHA